MSDLGDHIEEHRASALRLIAGRRQIDLLLIDAVQTAASIKDIDSLLAGKKKRKQRVTKAQSSAPILQLEMDLDSASEKVVVADLPVVTTTSEMPHPHRVAIVAIANSNEAPRKDCKGVSLDFSAIVPIGGLSHPALWRRTHAGQASTRRSSCAAYRHVVVDRERPAPCGRDWSTWPMARPPPSGPTSAITEVGGDLARSMLRTSPSMLAECVRQTGPPIN